MAAIFSYGGFTHEDDEVTLASLSYQKHLSPRGKGLSKTVDLTVWGEILADTTDLIIARAAAIIAAYKNDYSDARMTVNGTLAHALLNTSDCISGVRVIETSFPRGDPDELATVRTFWVKLRATYDAVEDDLVSWTESIERIGNGGPKFALVDTTGGPIAVYYTNSSAKLYSQSGSAVGYTGYPNPAAPIITGIGGPFNERERVGRVSGRNVGKAIRFYTTKWSYQFVQNPNGTEFLPTSQ